MDEDIVPEAESAVEDIAAEAGLGLVLPPVGPSSVSGSLRYSCTTSVDGSSVVVDSKRSQHYKTMTGLIGEAITSAVFPHKKFIQQDSQLDYGSKIQKAVCKYLNITDANAEAYWTEERREVARKKLTKKRNNVSEQVKRTMIGKY